MSVCLVQFVCLVNLPCAYFHNFVSLACTSQISKHDFRLFIFLPPHAKAHTYDFVSNTRAELPYTSFRSATFDTRPNRTGLLVEEVTKFYKKKNPTRSYNVSKFSYSIFMYEAQNVVGDTPPIIRSLKLNW